MSEIIKSRHSSHRWRNKTRCKREERYDYGVTYSMTLSQEQSRKLLMYYHGFYKRVCAQNKWVIFLSQNIAPLVCRIKRNVIRSNYNDRISTMKGIIPLTSFD